MGDKTRKIRYSDIVYSHVVDIVDWMRQWESYGKPFTQSSYRVGGYEVTVRKMEE